VQDDHFVGGVNESAQSFNFRALNVFVGLVDAYFVQAHLGNASVDVHG
jgi:hypothetical protein